MSTHTRCIAIGCAYPDGPCALDGWDMTMPDEAPPARVVLACIAWSGEDEAEH